MRKRLLFVPAFLFLVLAALVVAANVTDTPASSHSYSWQLDIRIDNVEEKLGLYLFSAGSPEPLARKFDRIQRYIHQETGKEPPLFMTPRAALKQAPAVDVDRLGVPLMDIDVRKAIALLCELSGLEFKITEYGILFDQEEPGR